MSSGAAGRRDTPAARAALARRRQRAAQSLMPSSSNNAPTTASTSKNAAPQSSKKIPPKPSLTVDTNPSKPSKTNTTFAEAKSTIPSKLPRFGPSVDKPHHSHQRSPTAASVMDTTHTTAPSTLGTSPDKNSPPTQYTKGTPKQALAKSKQAADQATGILNAVNARNRYRSSSPNSGSQPNQTRQIPSPGRLAQQEELLTASKRRREDLESSRQKFTPPRADLKVAANTNKPSTPRPPQSPQTRRETAKTPARSRSGLQPNIPTSAARHTASPAALTSTRSRSSHRTSLQVRAMQMGRSKSPMTRKDPSPAVSHSPYRRRPSPQRQWQPPPPSPGYQQPAAESLSVLMMDTSMADTSTLADMTLHEIETPRNTNSSFAMHTLRHEDEETSSHQHADYSINFSQSQEPFTPSQGTAYQSVPPPRAQHEKSYQTSFSGSEFMDLDDYSLDAAVLMSGSNIVLRSYSQPWTVGTLESNTTNTETTPKHVFAGLTGFGLARDYETLIIQKVVSKHETPGQEDTSAHLRRGDTVMLLQSQTTKATSPMALGVRKFVNSSGNESNLELGFFSNQAGKAEIWEILSAHADQEILVGRAAFANKETRRSKNSEDHASAMPASPIRSGDAISLRNCHNGGILSITDDFKLVLFTDSFQHGERGSNHDPTLLGRLQQHDRLYLTPNDMFQMILTSTPPCPPWVARHSRDERVFSTGSYALCPGRHSLPPDLDMAVFASAQCFTSPVLEEAEHYVGNDENLSPRVKEKILIDQVLGSFLGLEGRHIRLRGVQGDGNLQNLEFCLVEEGGVTFDIGLRNLIEQILPLSTCYVRVRNFVAAHFPGYEYGRVMQAFCEALDALLQDYVHFVSQMEDDFRKNTKGDLSTALTMKSIYFQITPSLHSMSIMDHATVAVYECKGGELINSLWALDKRSYMGDNVAKRVLGILLEKASVPYMDMMSDWLQTGKLNDPYEEFMVQKGETKSRTVFDGDSWRVMFQINEHHVIQSIAPNNWTKDKILTTGKYWNAVQECHQDSKDVPRPTKQSKIPNLPFDSDSSAIAAFVDAKYQLASKTLVQILMDNFKLVESLQIMKRYFLVDQGDFLTHFLDAAEEELLKPREDVSMGRLQHWLNSAVQLTEAHREEWDPITGTRMHITACPLIPGALRCRLSEETLVAHLDSMYGGGIADQGPITPSRRAYGSSSHVTGIEVFTIDFPRVPFPISLLMSEKSMDDYKLLFRHLFFAKHVERRLIGVWRDNQLLKKLDILRGLLGPTFLLRQRMLHFVQNLIYYMMFEVVETHWTEMKNSMDEKSSGRSEKPQTVDEILDVHNMFLERTLEACLLTNSEVIRSLTKLMNTCLLFTDQMKRFMETTKIHNDSLFLAAEKRGVVQRTLNERGLSQASQDKAALRKALSATREERRAIHNRQVRRVGREVNSDSYQRMVRRFDEVFNQDLGNFMRQLNVHTTSNTVANLGIRLDYNGYVTTTIANSKE